MALAGWSSLMRCSTSTARQLICCRFTRRTRVCLLIRFSWLMPRAYGRLPFLQDGNSEGFFTASFQVSDYAIMRSQPSKWDGRLEQVLLNYASWKARKNPAKGVGNLPPGKSGPRITVAVGTTIADRPPRRSVRARLRIRLLLWMNGGETHCLPHTVQSLGHALLALCRTHV